MITIEGTFAKIGRNNYDPPLVESFKGRDEDVAFEKIYKFVGKRMASREIEVEYLTDGTGAIFAGGRPAGSFTWKKVSA